MSYIDCESVNAQSAKALYQKALDKYLKANKVYVISDNARYYKNKKLAEWIRNTTIKQIYRTKELFSHAIHDFLKI